MFRRRYAWYPARVYCPKLHHDENKGNKSVSIQETCVICQSCGGVNEKGVNCLWPSMKE